MLHGGTGTKTDPFIISLPYYTVTFDCAGFYCDNIVGSVTLEEGEALGNILAEIEDEYTERFGYLYVIGGWFTENGEQITADTPITRNLTLYPDFEGLPVDPIDPVDPVDPV